MNVLDFFFDPVLRGPTLGTLFMCIASSLMGAILFLKKRTLLAESLSHAAYPGVVFACFVLALLGPQFEAVSFLAVLVGAFLSSLLGLKTIEKMERRKVSSDAALSFVLSLFFGLGIVGISALQATYPSWSKNVQMLLLGQAATMNDGHIALYGGLTLLVVSFLLLLFRPLQAVLFDRSFAASVSIPVTLIEKIVFWLLLFSLIIGMRSVGVVLISGMVVAPAVAARQFTDRLQTMLALSALFGALSGLLGNMLSVKISATFPLPTGPMIILAGSCFALFSLCFAPKRGLLFRLIRIGHFRLRCIEENILKGLWKKGALSFTSLKTLFPIAKLFLHFVMRRLENHGWVIQQGGLYHLSRDGIQKAEAIVRLHRLWELYLTQTLKFQAEKVHKTAEEMEHILTPDLEERLIRHLANPKHDPHAQPIPEKPRFVEDVS